MNMDKLMDELIRDEGLRLKVYLDSEGIETIGVGRNLQKGITRDEAMFLLNNDIRFAIQEAMTFPWYEKLTEQRKRVIVNMIFNLGLTRFSGFKNTIRYLEMGDYEAASEEMLDSKWARQVGVRATRLSDMMRNGNARRESDGMVHA